MRLGFDMDGMVADMESELVRHAEALFGPVSADQTTPEPEGSGAPETEGSDALKTEGSGAPTADGQAAPNIAPDSADAEPVVQHLQA